MPQDIDPKVKKLVSAIAQTETGQASPDAYRKRGASGEYGRYQFMPDTWRSYASQAGINKPLEESTIEDQNKVAYHKIKSLKDKGYTPAQIASMWNAGEGEPDAYKGTFSSGKPSKGVNAKGVQFDVPGYAQKVSAAYQNQQGGTYLPPAPPAGAFTPAEGSGVQNVQNQLGIKPEGFLNQLGQNVTQAGQGIEKAVQDTKTGAINPASGVLQGVGAGAGLVGTTVDTALSNLPLGVGKAYQWGSEKLGQAIGGAAEATGAADAFRNLSPETQGNIGAAGNIASVVPLFKALGTGKRGFADAMTGIKKGSIKKEAVGELEQKLGNSQLATRLADDGAVKRLVDKDILPDVVETGKDVFTYNVDDAMSKIDKEMKAVIKKQDDVASKQTATYKQGELGGYSKLDKDTKISTPVQDSLENLKKHFESTYDQQGQLWWKQMETKLKGDQITVQDMNDIARELTKAKNSYLASGDLSSSIPKQAWENLRRDLKDAIANRDATGEMRKLDKDYSQMVNEKKALIKLKGKRVRQKKEGFVKGLLREVPGAGLVLPKTTSTATMRLRRKRPLRETARKGLMQVGVGQGLANQQGQGKR